MVFEEMYIYANRDSGLHRFLVPLLPKTHGPRQSVNFTEVNATPYDERRGSPRGHLVESCAHGTSPNNRLRNLLGDSSSQRHGTAHGPRPQRPCCWALMSIQYEKLIARS